MLSTKAASLPPPPFAKKHRLKARLVVWIVLLVAASPFLYAGASCGYWLVWGRSREIANRERLILYNINPTTVLTACRQIRANQAKYRGNPEWHPVPPSGSDNPDPADPQMPPVISTLKPSYIGMTPQGVRIEMGGGFLHFGLAEQLPGASTPPLAVKLLAPGLWYYAEDGKAPPP